MKHCADTEAGTHSVVVFCLVVLRGGFMAAIHCVSCHMAALRVTVMSVAHVLWMRLVNHLFLSLD